MSGTASRARFAGLLLALLLISSLGAFAWAQTDPLLQAELEAMLERDQAGRLAIEKAEQRYGPESAEVQALWEKQRREDALHLQRLDAIVLSSGWPGRSKVGQRAAMAAFLIVQHADHATQVRYLPLIESAVENSELDSQTLAFLTDRIRIREGRQQLYGTQTERNEVTGVFELLPIEDEAHVDARRATLGMGPLREYLDALNAP